MAYNYLSGQKGRIGSYRYYILAGVAYSATFPEGTETGDYDLVRATNPENAKNFLTEQDFALDNVCDYGGVRASVHDHFIIGEENGYDSRDEAFTAFHKLRRTGVLNNRCPK